MEGKKNQNKKVSKISSTSQAASKTEKRQRERPAQPTPTQTTVAAPAGSPATLTPVDNTQRILEVRRIMKQRDEARDANNLIKTDELKAKLIEMGVFVRDQKGGPSGWRFLDGTNNKLPPGYKIPDDAIRHKRRRDESSDPPEVESTPTSRSESRAKKVKTSSEATKSSESARNLALLRQQTEATSTAQSIGQRTVENVGITDKSVGSGPEAQQGSRVKVHYVGKLKTTGKIFDASTKKPFQFRLGAGEVIRGWDVGVKGMRVGGQRTLVIPPEKAYGRHGAPPTIPGNAWLVFDVKLLEVK
jgi:FKBP-type peptidyl-prolyl cis-trans isomerase